jgi:very-short-patch-repair endonuclease
VPNAAAGTPLSPPLKKGGEGGFLRTQIFKPKVGYADRLQPLARQLRGHQTECETKLWQALRRDQLGVRFYRQRPLGRFIADFYCPALALGIELDGGQHFEPMATKNDASRDALLASMGVKVLRFDNRQIATQFHDVLSAIHQAVQKSPRRDAPTPFFKGGNTSYTQENP